jgi:hypothetical protein
MAIEPEFYIIEVFHVFGYMFFGGKFGIFSGKLFCNHPICFFQELVHLDNVFLQAAATIFNKDIVLVSPDTESPLVLLGGPNNTRGKGAPFLLGYLPAVDDVPCQYFSVVPARPGSSPDWMSGNAAEAGTGLPCADGSATAADEVSNLEQNDEESVEKLLEDQNNDSSPVTGVEQQSGHIWEATNGIDTATTDLSGVNSGYPLAGGEVVMRATSGRSWKRMDSYSGSLSRDLDQMIQEIQSGSDLQELYAKLDHCDDDQEENDKYEEEKDEEEEKEGNNDDENEEDEKEVAVNCDVEEEEEEEMMNNDAEKEEDERQVEDEKEMLKDEVNDDGEEEWEEVANYCDGKEEEEVLDENDGQEAGDSKDNINDHNRVDETVVEDDERYNQEVEETKEELYEYEAEKEAAEYEEEQGEDEKEDLWEEQNEKQEEQNHVMEEAMDAEEGSDPKQIDQNTQQGERRSSQIRRRIRITATLSQDEEEGRTSWDPAGPLSDSGSTARLGWSDAAAGNEPTEVETDGGSEGLHNNTVNKNSIPSTASALVCSNSRQCIQEPSTSGPGEDDTSQGEDQYIPLAYLSAETPLSPVVEITATDDSLRPVALVSTPDGQQTEVPLRAAAASGQQQRYRRKGSRASYRWSGQEMYQVDGPPTFTSNGLNATEEPEVDCRPPSGGAGDPDAVRKVSDALAAEATAQAAEDRLASRLAKYGLAVSRPAATDCDSCFKALIDQMTQPGQDFPAWDRDDHTFLRWYVCKQLEILAASGRGADYIQAASGRDGADDSLAGEEQQSDMNATLASFQVPAVEIFANIFVKICFSVLQNFVKNARKIDSC